MKKILLSLCFAVLLMGCGHGFQAVQVAPELVYEPPPAVKEENLCASLYAMNLVAGSTEAADAGGSCDTPVELYDSLWVSTTDVQGDLYICQKVSVTYGATVTKYIINSCDNGSDVGTLNVSLYTHDVTNDDPETEISGSEVSLAMSALADCSTYTPTDATLGTEYEIDEGSGTYWVCTEEQSSAVRVAPYDQGTGERICFGSTHGSLTCFGNYSFMADVWGCEP